MDRYAGSSGRMHGEKNGVFFAGRVLEDGGNHFSPGLAGGGFAVHGDQLKLEQPLVGLVLHEEGAFQLDVLADVVRNEGREVLVVLLYDRLGFFVVAVLYRFRGDGAFRKAVVLVSRAGRYRQGQREKSQY